MIRSNRGTPVFSFSLVRIAQSYKIVGKSSTPTEEDK